MFGQTSTISALNSESRPFMGRLSLFNQMRLLQEHVLEDEESRKHVHDGRNVVPLAAEEVDEDIGDNTKGNTFGDAVEQRHGKDAEVSGNGGSEVVFRHFELCHVVEHEEAHDDKRRSRGKGRDSCKQRGEQRGNEEEEGCGHSRKAGSAAGGYTSRGFHKGGHRGGAEHSTGGGGEGVSQKGGTDLRQAALFVKHLSLGADTDEGSQRVEKVDKEEGENDHGEVEHIYAAHREVETLTKGEAELGEVSQAQRGQEGEKASRRVRDIDTRELAEDTQHPRKQDTEQDGAADILDIQHGGDEGAYQREQSADAAR